MKTQFNLNLLFIVFLVLLVSFSCSKERIEDPVNKEKQNDYVNMDGFYDLHEPIEQTFIIDSTGTDTIVGMDGTKIWGIPKTIFMIKSTMQDIDYPYTLKLIEAYSIKNMILSRLSGIAQGNILHSAGEVKITAFKNADELAIKEHCALNFWAPTSTPVPNMDTYYGFTNGTTNDFNNDVLQTDYLFTQDNLSAVNIAGSGYHAAIVKTGWVNIGKGFNAPSQTGISFTATGSNTNHIDVYIIFNNLNNFIKVNNLSAPNMPVGEDITVFALAKDSNGIMYYFKDDYTIAGGLQIPLNMTASTEAQILSIMDGL